MKLVSLLRFRSPVSAARALVIVALAALAAVFACGGGFDPQSKVDSVRLFVIRADKPYVKPGETVTFQALMTDARKVQPAKAKLYWIPILCLNPASDLYYLCFAPPGDGGHDAQGTRLIPIGAAAGDAGADASAADAGGGAAGALGGSNPFANIPTDIDLGPFLPQGPTFSFTMPTDSVKARPGSDPYGLGIVFSVLCAGQVRFQKRDPAGGAQQVPVLCTDENGVQLTPADYVIGISRVYAYTERTNTNPVIEAATFANMDVVVTSGITIDKCTTAKQKDCPENKIGIRVSDASWELDPSDVTRSGDIHEQIWVDYYSDIGAFDDEARLLFDTGAGRISDSDVTFRAPPDVTDGTMWAVVHDNRGGAAWLVIPLHIR